VSEALLTSTRKTAPTKPGKDWPQQEMLESRKTRYTRRVISEAFIELLQEKPIEKITVTRICEIADISRGTFYLHFNDPYDLLDRMENGFLADLEQKLFTNLTRPDTDYSEDTNFWLVLLDGLLESKHLTELFFSNRNSSFITKCLALNRSYSEDLCKTEFPTMTQRERDYTHTFYEYGSFSVIGMWVREGFKESSEQIASILALLNSKR